ncbi:MAG: hypothetical protein AABY04_02345 [Candidatus Micrarchaeota archaeon]
MNVSKPGIISLLIGALVVIAVATYGFAGQSVLAIVFTTLMAGLILFGLFLMLVGALMLIV